MCTFINFLDHILNIGNNFFTDLAYEENCMGRFLKDFGKLDKTKAGKIMIASGKAMSYSSQQRLALRPSIMRLAEEVDTFRYRAIEDTSDTVSGKALFKNYIIVVRCIFFYFKLGIYLGL